MATPHATPPAAPDDHAPAAHHGSWAPIIIASSVAFLYLGLLFPKQTLPIGVPIAALGLGWWIREDIKAFRAKLAHPAAEHGAPGPLWGMALFIATEVMIFGSIFAVWFVGKAELTPKGEWPLPGVDLPITSTGVNTAILVLSGATLHWGYLRLKKGHFNGYLLGLSLTILLGLTFLIQQVREYLELIAAHGFTIQSKLYGSAFFMLTGTHGVHVAGGLIFLSVILFRSIKKTQSKEKHLALETAAMYWHFVDVVWLFLYAVVYLRWL